MNSGVDEPAEPTRHRRTRYFDRPKHPKDWRWFVGGFGKILIVLGLLMFGFVGYQLWGTGLQTARAQNRLEDEFQAALQSTSTSTLPPSTTTTEPDPGETVPPTVSTSSTVPVAATTIPVDAGAALGKLTVASIGLDWVFVEGVGVQDLRKGPGHFRETPMPGQLGNSAIAGHRTTYGHPFLELDQIQVGDPIEVQTLAGHYVYIVDSKVVVSPADYAQVIPTVDPAVATLTLATCDPAYSARNRLIIHAVLAAADSDQVFAPSWTTSPPTTAPAVTETLPGEDQPGDSSPLDTVADTVSDTLADTVPDTVADPTDTVPAIAAFDDTFQQGWFDDGPAIPHVLAWGLVLAGVAVGSYLIAKRCRRLWVAFLVGTVPFVVVLYFWYENVNRLLPPGI